MVFGAINEREGALRELIVNADNTFQATQERDEALAETFSIFPTFLDESKATLARLEGLLAALASTIRDLGILAPDLERLFRDLRPLVRVGRLSVRARGHLRRDRAGDRRAPSLLPGTVPS